jgi:serine phosphatase RsbU (regulator of sigma subunit)
VAAGTERDRGGHGADPAARAGGRRPHPELVKAVVLLKKAAALANRRIGLLPETLALAIVDAADEALWEPGRLDRYVGDRFRAGSGALLDAEVNRALASRANVLLVGGGGERAPVRAAEHVGMSQTADIVVPAATRVAAVWGWELLQAALVGSDRGRWPGEDGESDAGHLRSLAPLALAARELVDPGLSPAAGSAPPAFAAAWAEEMSALTGWDVVAGGDRAVSVPGDGDLVRFSAALRVLAVELAGRSRGGHAGPAGHMAPTGRPADAHRVVEMAAYVITGNDVAVSLVGLDAGLGQDAHTVVLGDLIPSSLRLLANAVHAGLRPDEGAVPPQGSPAAPPSFVAAPEAGARGVAVPQAAAQEALEAAIVGERRKATQLQVLHQLAVVLNSERDAGRMLDQVLRGAAQLTGARSGSLYLVEQGGLRLQAFTTQAGGSRKNDAQPHPGVETRGLARRAVQERRLVRSQETADAPGRLPGHVATPLVAVDGELLGSIVLASAAEAGGFSSEDEMLAQTLAAHVAVALQNMRRLEHEQQVAEYLQRSMLPRIPRIRGLELEVTYQSASDQALVGGDFYDVMDVGRRHVALAVGDVCGKGLMAASQMTMVRHMLRAHASHDTEPGIWLSMVNDSMERNLSGAEFVTLALVVMDASTGILDYAMAGHPPPLLAARRGTWDLSGEPGLPLGVKKGGVYKSHRAFMPKGATLFLFTDGLYEARVEGHLFGRERLHAVAQELGAAPVRGGPARLVEEARAFAGGRLADDVVVLEARLSAE